MSEIERKISHLKFFLLFVSTTLGVGLSKLIKWRHNHIQFFPLLIKLWVHGIFEDCNAKMLNPTPIQWWYVTLRMLCEIWYVLHYEYKIHLFAFFKNCRIVKLLDNSNCNLDNAFHFSSNTYLHLDYQNKQLENTNFNVHFKWQCCQLLNKLSMYLKI